MAEKYKNIKYPIRNEWAWCLMKDVVYISSGNTPKGINDVKLKPQSNIDFYKVSDMNTKGNKKYMKDSALKVTLSEASSLKLKLEEPSTIIFPKRGGAILTNKKRILSKKSAYDLNLMGVKEKSEIIENKFLWFWFQKLDLSRLYDGSSVPQINNKDIEPLWFPVAPLPEQRAIVAKIEQLFSDLGNGIANLKKAQEQLKIYRQAVLKKAFVGELTRKWREEQTDLASAEELLQQIKEEREKHYQKQLDEWEKAVKEWEDKGKGGKKPSRSKKPKELPPLSEEELNELPELPEVWCWKKIGNICECIVPNRDKPKSFTGNVKWITTPDLQIDSIRINYSNVEKGLSEMEIKKYNAKVIPLGSVIMTCVGKFGISAIVEKRIVVNQQLHAFLPVNFCYNKYLAYCIQYNKAFFEKRATSTTIQYLNKNNCNSMPFSFCSLEEQHQIVKEIETRLSVCDKLEATIAEALQKSEALRQSILKKAFDGKLLNEK
jgi:type I restriction enzyme S subunit